LYNVFSFDDQHCVTSDSTTSQVLNTFLIHIGVTEVNLTRHHIMDMGTDSAIDSADDNAMFQDAEESINDPTHTPTTPMPEAPALSSVMMARKSDQNVLIPQSFRFHIQKEDRRPQNQQKGRQEAFDTSVEVNFVCPYNKIMHLFDYLSPECTQARIHGS